MKLNSQHYIKSTKKQVSLDWQYTLWWLLWQTRDAIFRVRQKELSRFGITSYQRVIMFVAEELCDSPTPSEITHWILREPHSVSELINRMEQKGLIKKEKDPERANLVRVVLTEKGRAAYQESRSEDCIHHIFSCLNDDECQQLHSILEKLGRKALNELGRSEAFLLPPEHV